MYFQQIFAGFKFGTEMKAIIYIYDYIGSESVSANYIRQIVSQYEDQGIEEFEVHINSMGGSVFEGLAIYNILKSKNVNVIIDGVAASIASVVAMCGKKIYMHSSSMLMVHNPWTFADGDSDQLKKNAEMLEKVKESIVMAYIEKTKLPKNELEEMMNQETWLTAKEAMKKGFCDEIIKIENFKKDYIAAYAMLRDDDSNNNLKDTKMLSVLLAMFGLPPTATEQEIEQMINALRSEFGMDEKSTIFDLLKKIKNEPEPTGEPEPKDEPEPGNGTEPEPQKSQNELLQELLEERAESLINNAVSDFKILAVDADIWKERAMKDYRKTKAELEKRPKNFVKPSKLNKPQPHAQDKKNPVQAAADFLKEQGRTTKAIKQDN